MIGLVLGTVVVGSIPVFIYRRRSNGHEPMPKHKRGGSIIALCLIVLLFLTQAFGANVFNNGEGTCPAGGKSRMHAGDEFDPFHDDDRYDEDDD